jgi:hypothetical protein
MRAAWVIWCLAWAGFWTFSLLVGNLLAIVLIPISLLSILLPVGKTQRVVIENDDGC